MSAPIAIVGIGCRFPGGVNDPASFWHLLTSGRDAIGEIPKARMDVAHYFDPRPATPGRIMTRRGGFLDGLEDFDASFFGISPREAERLDPQQRLLLETTWEALEDAGVDVRRLEGSNAGVFVGQWTSDFEGRLFADPEAVDFYMTTGSGRYAASGRISYALGLRGASLTIDSACSSSLAAVHLAVRSIRAGESDVALAGGANVILQPHVTIAYSQSRMMAPDGRCKFGDASADGYVRSEGAAIIVLKSLDRALADGDRIYALVRGSAINNDGRSSGSMGTPSRLGQEELLRTAYRDAGVAPGRVRYVEAHGTGTLRGDPVELGALGAVLHEGRPPERRAYVGSVKTNIGHTEAAAGVAGLIKTALALHHGAIPASLHYQQPSPNIPWAELPLEIPRTQTPWPDGEGARVASVSAFGIAGTNAHVVLEEAPPSSTSGAAVRPRELSLLPLSAKSPEALKTLASRYADVIDGGASLDDVCWSAAARRTALDLRAAFVAMDRASLSASLRRYAAGEPASVEGTADARPPRIVFVFPGQGAQWIGMGRELAAKEPVFREALERCERACVGLDWSLLEQLHAEPGTPGYQLDRIDVIQPVLVALAIGYAALWRSLGVTPDAVIGHSMGEVAAAYVAGVLDLEQAMQIICRRSALMRRASGRGAMALVELSMEDAQTRIGARTHQLGVAVSNSPRSSVVSGDADAVNALVAELERDGVFCRLVKVDVASHSPHMDPLAAELARELASLKPSTATVPIHSTVLGRRVDGNALDASYWARNLRQPVLFGKTVQALLEEVPAATRATTVFVELGPHPILLTSIEQTASSLAGSTATIACGRRDEPEQAAMLTALGALWTLGSPIDWTKALPTGRSITLPLYPWQRERHWLDLAELGAARRTATSHARPDEESLGWMHELRWSLAEITAPKASETNWLILSNDREGSVIADALRGAGARAEIASLENLEQATRNGDRPSLLVVATEGVDTPYLPLRVLQAVLRAPAERRPRIWFVTTGAQATGQARVAVEQGALWGAARVVAEEHPEIWGGLVDRDPAAASTPEAISVLVRHLLANDGEDQVALRGGKRFVLRLEKAARGAPVPFEWRSDGAYLVTGGLGDIGLHIARAIAAEGVRRLILIGRTALPERSAWSNTPAGSAVGKRIEAVRALESMGVAVHTASFDIGDEMELRAFLDRYAAEGWPPIRGVIHAAGILDNHLASAMDRTAFDALVGPKLHGARLLDRLLPDLDLFVTFSSTGAFLAQPGQANYAAANAGLDALAHDRRARGLPALSIEWGVWTNTGLVRGEAGERNVAEMARQGIGAFSPERGTKLFTWLLGRETSAAVAVLPLDYAVFARARAERPLFRDLVRLDAGHAPEHELRSRLESASMAERKKLVEGVVRQALGKVLKVAPECLDAKKALGTMGLGSLLSMELRNRLEAALGRPLSTTLTFNYPTIATLVDHLAGLDAPPPITTDAVVEVRAEPDTELQQIAELSDEEALLALRSPGRTS